MTNKMKRFVQILAVALVVAACGTKEPEVKYVFYFIGDGMGINHVVGTEQYNAATGMGPDSINFNHFPVRNYISTFSLTSLVTDSAAAGTALATGFKTYDGAVGMDQDNHPVPNLAEMAKAAGCGVAVMSSVGVNHATPSCFLAHAEKRNLYGNLAEQLCDSQADFIAGACFMTGRKPEHPREYYENMAQEKGYAIFRGPDVSAAGFADGKVICLSGKQDLQLPYAIDRQEDDTSLKDFVSAGIAYMERHYLDKGFFMMVEGGEIDYAGHSNDAVACFRELTDMAYCVDLALEFQARHPETLIVVTADHETGGLMLSSGGYVIHPERLAWQKYSIDRTTELFREAFFPEGEPYKAPSWEQVKSFLAEHFGLWENVDVPQKEEENLKKVYAETFGKGGDRNLSVKNLYTENYKMVSEAILCLDRIAGYQWSHPDHSGSPVGLYVKGAADDRFNTVKDNAQIAPIIAELAGY